MSAPATFPKLRGEGQPSRVQDNVSATLDPLARAVGATPIMGAPPPAWILPDIISTSGFADVHASIPLSPLARTAYHRDALGYVHGKFTLVTAAGSAANTTAFTLNADHRPAETLVFYASDGGGLFWEITINSAGAFIVITLTGAGAVVAGTFNFLAGA